MSNRETELIRRVNPVPDGLPAPPIEPVLRRLDQELAVPDSARRRPGLPSLGGVMAALAVVTAVAVAVLALVLLGHTRSRTAKTPDAPATTTSVGSHPAAYRPLLSILGVLRRPQTEADRDPALLDTLRRQSQNLSLSVLDGKPAISLVRLATIAPWGAKIFLVPYRPLTRQAIAKLPRKQQVLASATKMSLGIYGTGLTSGFLPAADIEGGRDLANSATGHSDQAAMVLPDGVAKVALWNSTGSIRAHPHPLIAPGSKPVVVAVHNNVAAFRSRRLASIGHEVWYGPSGKVIKRIANASSCGPPLGNCS